MYKLMMPVRLEVQSIQIDKFKKFFIHFVLHIHLVEKTMEHRQENLTNYYSDNMLQIHINQQAK